MLLYSIFFIYVVWTSKKNTYCSGAIIRAGYTKLSDAKAACHLDNSCNTIEDTEGNARKFKTCNGRIIHSRLESRTWVKGTNQNHGKFNF